MSFKSTTTVCHEPSRKTYQTYRQRVHSENSSNWNNARELNTREIRNSLKAHAWLFFGFLPTDFYKLELAEIQCPPRTSYPLEILLFSLENLKSSPKNMQKRNKTLKICSPTSFWRDRQTERQADRWIDRRTEGQIRTGRTDTRTDGRTGQARTDRQDAQTASDGRQAGRLARRTVCRRTGRRLVPEHEKFAPRPPQCDVAARPTRREVLLDIVQDYRSYSPSPRWRLDLLMHKGPYASLFLFRCSLIFSVFSVFVFLVLCYAHMKAVVTLLSLFFVFWSWLGRHHERAFCMILSGNCSYRPLGAF